MPNSILVVILLLIAGAGVGWLFLKMARKSDNWLWFGLLSFGLTALMLVIFENGVSVGATSMTLIPLVSFIAILIVNPEID